MCVYIYLYVYTAPCPPPPPDALGHAREQVFAFTNKLHAYTFSSHYVERAGVLRESRCLHVHMHFMHTYCAFTCTTSGSHARADVCIYMYIAYIYMCIYTCSKCGRFLHSQMYCIHTHVHVHVYDIHRYGHPHMYCIHTYVRVHINSIHQYGHLHMSECGRCLYLHMYDIHTIVQVHM